MKTNDFTYGFYPYGNEILSLPHSIRGINDANKNHCVSECSNILASIDNPIEELLYRFRWTLGHHISFLCWIFISKYLQDNLHLQDKEKILFNVHRCNSLMHLMNCMYVYTATVPSPIYCSSIRHSMEMYFSGFSAAWAKDYMILKDMIQKYCNIDNLILGKDMIRSSFDKTKIVHFIIAGKLVKDRKSLLQQQNNPHKLVCPSQYHKIYDNFFLVDRVNYISEKSLINGLIKRLYTVLGDLKQNGLLNKNDPDIGVLTNNKVTSTYIVEFADIIQQNIKIFAS